MFAGASGGCDERAEPSLKWRKTKLPRASVCLSWEGDNKKRWGKMKDVRRPVWEEQAVNTNNMEVVETQFYPPVRPPCSQAPRLPPGPSLPPSPGAQEVPVFPVFPHPWLLHPGGEDLQKVALQCCLAVLMLLIMKIRQEFIILL